MNNVFAICRTGIDISVRKQNEKAAMLRLLSKAKRPGFKCSVPKFSFGALRMVKCCVLFFGIGVNKSRKLG